MKFSKFSDDDDWTAHHSSGCSRLFLYRLIGGCALSPNFDRLHFDRPGRDGIARSTITTRFWSEGSSVRGEGQEYPLDVMPPPANHERVDSFRPSLVKVLKSYPGHIVKSLLPEVNTESSQHSRCSANSLVVSLTRITCLYWKLIIVERVAVRHSWPSTIPVDQSLVLQLHLSHQQNHMLHYVSLLSLRA